MASKPAKKPAKAKPATFTPAKPYRKGAKVVTTDGELQVVSTDKRPPGRPSKYQSAFVEQARKLCMLGATDREMADFFEVKESTLNLWKLQHPEFSESLKEGKDVADNRVVRSLYQQAIGYEQDEVKIFMPAQADAPVYAPYRAKIAPSTTATIFWLKNRRREDWREKVDHEHSGTVTVKATDKTDAELLAIATGQAVG